MSDAVDVNEEKDCKFLLEIARKNKSVEGVSLARDFVRALYFREIGREDDRSFWKEIKKVCCDGKSSMVFLHAALSRCIDSRKKEEVILDLQEFVSLIHLVCCQVNMKTEQYERMVNLVLNEAVLFWDKDKVVTIVAEEINNLKWFILSHEERKDTVNHMFINFAVKWLAEQAKSNSGDELDLDQEPDKEQDRHHRHHQGQGAATGVKSS